MMCLRTLAVAGALLLLSISMGCGSEPFALEGSWRPEYGAVTFSSGTMPYTYSRASEAGGGVVVEAAHDGYAVTLISSNGERIRATEVTMKDDALLVNVGAAQLSLTEESPGRVLMLWTTGGIPAPGSSVHLERGSPPSK